MALTRYDGLIQGDRLSPVLLYDAGTDLSTEEGVYLAPRPIVLGLNTTRKYKLAMKFHNPLSCPVVINDIQLLMCPVLANGAVRYYNYTTLSGLPASSVSVRVDAYTTVIGENDVEVFEKAASSELIQLNALSATNASYQYIAGSTHSSGYDTQFGSLGLFGNDTEKRLNPVTASFGNSLIIQPRKGCYFIFEVEECSNDSGGFAISAPVDYRAVNMNTVKSSGIMIRDNARWQPSTLHRRVNGEWVHEEMPSFVRDEVSI